MKCPMYFDFFSFKLKKKTEQSRADSACITVVHRNRAHV